MIHKVIKSIIVVRSWFLLHPPYLVLRHIVDCAPYQHVSHWGKQSIIYRTFRRKYIYSLNPLGSLDSGIFSFMGREVAWPAGPFDVKPLVLICGWKRIDYVYVPFKRLCITYYIINPEGLGGFIWNKPILPGCMYATPHFENIQYKHFRHHPGRKLINYYCRTSRNVRIEFKDETWC
jgi:hypothetical protein